MNGNCPDSSGSIEIDDGAARDGAAAIAAGGIDLLLRLPALPKDFFRGKLALNYVLVNVVLT